MTDIEVRRLKPKDKPYTVRLDKSLYMTIHSNGSKYIYHRYMWNGRRFPKNIGVFPFVSLAEAKEIQFEDRIKGCQQVDPFLLGDVILARKDIATSYHLAVVTDDAFEQITDVTRGEDLLSSTHVHRTLQSLLGLPAPVYHHHQLLLDERGKRLAKRTEALSLRTLRETGKSPQNVIAMLPPLQ